MKGDFSRNTFRKEKHYSKVNLQQGRVQVDADWNEQIDILNSFERTSLIDVIGQSGAPAENSGFGIYTTDGTSFWIGAGRFYVDGILIENEFDVEASEQPDLPLNKDGTSMALAVPSEFGIYLGYLDVWERHITELDDPEIKESALDGPDTATRNRIVWQVKLFPVKVDSEATGRIMVPADNQTINCQTRFPEWESHIALPTGTLQARTNPKIIETDECKIPPGAGYRRPENQLYRVEVHEPGGIDSGATFKWQRDNGTVVVQATEITEKTITVTSIGKDKLLGFNSQQWVEVIDDRYELLNLPGTLAKINVISETELAIVDGTVKGDPLTNDNFPQNYNPKVRRWDSPGGEMLITIPSSNEGYVALEDGVEVRFYDGGREEGAVVYRTGDYWLIPARTLRASIEWPRDDSSGPLSKLADGIEHHYARLALLKFVDNAYEVIDDCRHIFPPLTRLGPSHPIPAPTRSANISTWIHGNAVWAEKPDTIDTSKSHKQGEGAWFTLSGRLRSLDNWFHFPLSTSFVFGKPSQLLTKVFLVYNDVNIENVSLFDGPNNIGSVATGKVRLTSPPIIDTSGNSFASWEIDPPQEIVFGLGISVKVTFQEQSFLFSSAGAEFKSTL